MPTTPPHSSPRRRADTPVRLPATPLTLLLAAASIAITLVVVVGTVAHGRVSSSGPLELICAVLLAAVASADASRPGRRERLRRQTLGSR